MAQFVIDTSVVMTAHLTTYPLDVVPSFWHKLKQLADAGKITSINKLRGEILEKDDPLSDWIETNLARGFFRPVDDDVIVRKYADVAAWAVSKSNQYTQKAINEFLRFEKADAWLVA